MPAQLKIPTADTQLHIVDTPGGSPALLFLNGGFGTQQNWDRVIQRLAGKYRTVRFDARGRGKSGTSADYSVSGAVDDIGRVIQATGLERPILVGWSHGATLAVRYAAHRPGHVSGLVLIDGAYPITMFDTAAREKVHAQFRRLRWIMRIMAALDRSARMSAAEAAEVVIEVDRVNGELGADFTALECPAVYVIGSGAHSGATEEEMRTLRAAAADATARNERVSVFATTTCNHVQPRANPEQGPGHRGCSHRRRRTPIFLTSTPPRHTTPPNSHASMPRCVPSCRCEEARVSDFRGDPAS